MRACMRACVWCGVVWCGVVWCGVVWCGVVWCGVVWCGVVWCVYVYICAFVFKNAWTRMSINMYRRMSVFDFTVRTIPCETK